MSEPTVTEWVSISSTTGVATETICFNFLSLSTQTVFFNSDRKLLWYSFWSFIELFHLFLSLLSVDQCDKVLAQFSSYKRRKIDKRYYSGERDTISLNSEV